MKQKLSPPRRNNTPRADTAESAANSTTLFRGAFMSRALPPSPPAEKANTRQDQAGEASTDDGVGSRKD
jgi:hypothetical protein